MPRTGPPRPWPQFAPAVLTLLLTLVQLAAAAHRGWGWRPHAAVWLDAPLLVAWLPTFVFYGKDVLGGSRAPGTQRLVGVAFAVAEW